MISPFDDGKEKTDAFIGAFEHLRLAKPLKEMGVLYPDTPIILGDVSHVEVVRHLELLRDYADFWFLDDLTIKDGVLDTIRIAIICFGGFYRKETLEKIGDWVNKGGLLIGYNFADVRSIEDDECYYGRVLFDMRGGEKRVGKGTTLYIPVRVTLKENTPGEYLDILVLARQLGIPFADSHAYYQEHLFKPMTEFLHRQGYAVLDGVLDDVFVARVEDKILLLNTRDADMQKEITLPDGSKKAIALAANGIVEVECH